MAQDLPCGTTEADVSYSTEREPSNTRQLIGTAVCIDVYFHIVRQDDGSGGFDLSKLPAIIEKLNGRLNQFGIFINSGGYDFIDNSLYYDLLDSEFNSLLQQKVKLNAINFYLVENAPWAGRAIRFSNKLVVKNEHALKETSPHELGHCFGLLHTHYVGYYRENIERTGPNANCSYAGDGFCDTPADPDLFLDYKVKSCEYVGGETHPDSGLPYDPDVTNIMSYAPNYCRNSFSNEQGQAMLNNIYGYSVLQSTISSVCTSPSITGSATICNDNTETYSFNYPTRPDFWYFSDNLIKVSDNGTSITVKRKSGKPDQGLSLPVSMGLMLKRMCDSKSLHP